MSSRAVIIHSLQHAEAALSASSRLGRAVVLRSAPGAAAYMGAAVFAAMIGEAARACPGVSCSAVLDCGGDAGLALAALRHGVGRVKLDAPPAVLEKVAAMGAVLDDGQEEALDLLGRDDVYEACLEWLEKK